MDPGLAQAIGEAQVEHELRAENKRLRALLADVPILVINEQVGRILGEDEALQYSAAVKEWWPKAKAALETTNEQCQPLEGKKNG